MRVLVVDDNRDQLTALATLLQSVGQDVQTALNGSVALWIAATFRPDLVFLDLSLPYMDGYEIARAIRSMPECKATRIIALTGTNPTLETVRAAGFDALLHKPANLTQIAQALGA